ncbi:MAG: hypothetical protein HY088_00945 [Ignavibacteriales bacterium]|nr:hypothetical protein [Ignavibacteriales bacterium]
MIPDIPTSLSNLIKSHSVFIYEVGTSNFGSGVLIKIADRIFVLSAAHVIKADVDINLGIVPHESRFSILNKWCDPELDIGFMELSPFEANVRQSKYSAPFSTGSMKQGTIVSKRTTLALCGFPSGEASETNRGVEVPATFVAVAILAPEQWPNDLKSQLDPKKKFLIPYGEKSGAQFFDGYKNPRGQVVPFGMSGCGLWYFNPEIKNLDKPAYSLVGIQHGYYRHHQVLVGTLVPEVLNRISMHYGIRIPIDSADSTP